MSRSRDIAKILGVTEDNNPSSSRILFLDESLDSARVTSIADTTAPSLTVYDSINELPVQSLTAGAQAYVRSNNKLYVTLNNAYYNIATVNLTPTVSLDPAGTIVLSDSGQPSAIVTMIATDSDGRDADLTFSVESDGNMLGRATLTQDSSVFTIDPLTADSGATTGTFTLTFKANDGINIGTAAKDFSLTFASSGVDSSAPTVLLMKAIGSGADNADIDYQYGSNFTTQSLTFTSAGTPQATTFNPYRSGGYSTYFDGSGDYLNPKTALDGFTSTSDPWTIEFWIYNTGPWTTGYPTPIGLSRSSDGFNSFLWGNPSSASNDAIWFNNTTASTLISTVLEPHEWTHVALVYTGTQVSVYYNGTQVLAPVTIALGTALSSCEFGIGAEFDGANGGSPGNYHKGYMTEIRVSDIARYTTAFTAPTEALTDDDDTVFLLSQNDGYFKDASGGAVLNPAGDVKKLPFGPYDYNPTYTANQSAYGDAHSYAGSTYFDGSSTVYASGINLTGDYTVEGWVYITNIGSGYKRIFQNKQGNTNAGYWYFYHNGTNLHVYNVDGGTLTNVGTIPGANQWIHLAISRSGSTTKIFVNGKQTGTYSGSTSFTADTFAISGYNTEYMTGYVSDVRVVVGSGGGLYTSDFTPPTTPNTWVTNTALLAQTVYGPRVYDAAAANGLTLIGNTQSSQTQRKFTTSSAVTFDGTGDTAVVKSSDIFAYGTGDFTWEAWIYVPAAKSNHYLLDHGSNGGTMNIANTKIRYYNSTVGISSALYTTGATISYATWHHVAFVRSSGTTTIYVDGTAGASASDTHNYTALDLTIGDYGGGSYGYAGTLQDLRITKGYARYTAAFTPPTAEFEL